MRVKNSALRVQYQPTTDQLPVYYEFTGTFTGTKKLVDRLNHRHINTALARAGSWRLSLLVLNNVTDRLIAAHALGIHRRQNGDTAIHVIVNDDFTLAVVKTVQPANVLL